MARTATIRSQIEPELKEEAGNILKSPNAETVQTFKDSDKGENIIQTGNLDDLFNQLGLWGSG